MVDSIVLMLAGWLGFAVCAVWCISSVKRNVPITHGDAKLMWRMHRRSVGCVGHKWKPIRRSKGKIVGFQCSCGYEYTQKRPLVSRIPKHY